MKIIMVGVCMSEYEFSNIHLLPRSPGKLFFGGEVKNFRYRYIIHSDFNEFSICTSSKARHVENQLNTFHCAGDEAP